MSIDLSGRPDWHYLAWVLENKDHRDPGIQGYVQWLKDRSPWWAKYDYDYFYHLLKTHDYPKKWLPSGSEKVDPPPVGTVSPALTTRFEPPWAKQAIGQQSQQELASHPQQVSAESEAAARLPPAAAPPAAAPPATAPLAPEEAQAPPTPPTTEETTTVCLAVPVSQSEGYVHPPGLPTQPLSAVEVRGLPDSHAPYTLVQVQSGQEYTSL